MSNNENQRIAVMIDADNAQASICSELLAEIAKFGVTGVTKFRVALLLLTIILFSSVQALSQEKVVVVPLGGKGYEPPNPLVISPADFKPIANNVSDFNFSYNFGYINGTTPSTACLMAPVYLPNGVTVTKFTGLVYDNNPDNDPNLRLNRHSITTPLEMAETMADVKTSSDSTSSQEIDDTSINFPLIDMENYIYYVVACITNTNNRLYAVKIHYQK